MNIFNGIGDTSSLSSLTKLIENIANYAIDLIIIVCTIFIIIGGIQYITAGGNQEQAQKAKATLTWAIIGLILVLAAPILIKTFKTIIGSKK